MSALMIGIEKFVCMYACVFIYLCMYEYLNVCIDEWYIKICMYVCMCIYLFIYVCMYVCMYVWYGCTFIKSKMTSRKQRN
jgi:nuclear pore complex protein Nup62